MVRCMGCMGNIEEGIASCPLCGFETNQYVEDADYLPPGSILLGRYIVGKALGHGGFGITYLGWDEKILRKVAIKEYFPSDFISRTPGRTQVSIYTVEDQTKISRGIQQFLDEAQNLAALDQVPGIAHIYDYFEDNGTGYIVMEYLEGKDLRQILKEKNKLTYQETLCIVHPILDTLERVHRRGVIHRDIAPDNIFITSNDEVKLLDFGAARHAMSLNQGNQEVILKLGYAPIEQYYSEGVGQGPWTDVYAVGALIYRMLTGVKPIESVKRAEEETLPLLKQMGVEISEEEENAIMFALNVKGEYRFQTAKDFLESIGGKYEDGSGYVPPLPAPPPPDENPPPPSPNEKKSFGARVASVVTNAKTVIPIAILIGLVITAAFVVGRGREGDSVEVGLPEATMPRLVEMTLTEAMRELDEGGDGKEVRIIYEYDSNTPEDVVTKQEPEAGVSMPQMSDVTLHVSGNVNKLTIMDVRGRQKEEATTLLAEQGFQVGEVAEYSDTVEDERVINQSVEGNTVVQYGAAVELTCSIGPKAGYEVVMPSLEGMTKKEVNEYFGATEIDLEQIEFKKRHDEDAKVGNVVGQSPPKGQRVINSPIERSRITVTISKGERKPSAKRRNGVWRRGRQGN